MRRDFSVYNFLIFLVITIEIVDRFQFKNDIGCFINRIAEWKDVLKVIS